MLWNTSLVPRLGEPGNKASETVYMYYNKLDITKQLHGVVCKGFV